MRQLLRLHQKPFYGIVKDEAEWENLPIVIDLFYGGYLSEDSGDKKKDCIRLAKTVSSCLVQTLIAFSVHIGDRISLWHLPSTSNGQSILHRILIEK